MSTLNCGEGWAMFLGRHPGEKRNVFRWVQQQSLSQSSLLVVNYLFLSHREHTLFFPAGTSPKLHPVPEPRVLSDVWSTLSSMGVTFQAWQPPLINTLNIQCWTKGRITARKARGNSCIIIHSGYEIYCVEWRGFYSEGPEYFPLVPKSVVWGKKEVSIFLHEFWLHPWDALSFHYSPWPHLKWVARSVPFCWAI